MEMSDHEFLNPERTIQRTTFGKGPDQVIAVVNTGAADFPTKSRFGRNVILPPYGFLIESPTFVAAHVREWNRSTHPEGVMFTLRSQDGKDLRRQKRPAIHRLRKLCRLWRSNHGSTGSTPESSGVLSCS